MGTDYWKTQSVLKRKWLINQWPFRRSKSFQRFIILCNPRTGSTWLHTLLNSSSEIMSYGEVLSERDLRKGLEQTIWRPHHRSIKAVGCKIFYEQLMDPLFVHVFNEMMCNPAIKIIDLQRENIRDMYISFKIAMATGAWSSKGTNSNEQTEILIDKAEFEVFVSEIKQKRKDVLDGLGEHEIFPITYERLSKFTRTELIMLQKFIGVTPSNLFSLLKKQA